VRGVPSLEGDDSGFQERERVREEEEEKGGEKGGGFFKRLVKRDRGQE